MGRKYITRKYGHNKGKHFVGGRYISTFHKATLNALSSLALITFVGLSVLIVDGSLTVRAKANLVSALPEGVVYASYDAGTSEIRQDTTPSVELEPSEPIYEYTVNEDNEIEVLVHSYFGSDADIALAIMRAESGGRADALYRWGDEANPNRGECSVGLFQINLRSNDCKGKLVHWDKAEGETLEEKIAWLQIPENNIKVAYQIYKAQGFYPWSTFTNGKYGKYLEE